MLQQFIDGIGVGVGQLKAQNLCWSACQLSCTHTTRASSPALLQPAPQCRLQAEGRVSSPALLILGSRSPAPTRASSTVLLSQCPLSQVLQPVRGWTSSAALMLLELTHLHLSHQDQLHCVAQARSMAYSPKYCRQEEIPAGFPILMPLGPAHKQPLQPGTALPHCPGEVQDWLCS